MLPTSYFLWLAAAASALKYAPVQSVASSGSQCACQRLVTSHAHLTIMPNEPEYDRESTNFWDRRSNSLPSCIFLPVTDSQVAAAVAIFYACDAEFAIRGGGHMNVSYPICLRRVDSRAYK